MSFASPSLAAAPVTVERSDARRLTGLEKGLLAVGLFEIPLQIDSYLMYQAADAELGSVAGINVSLTTFCLLSLYGLWFLRSAVERAAPQARVILGVPLLLYLATVGLSVFAAEDPRLAFFDLVLLAQAYLLFCYLANRIRQPADVAFVVAVLAATLLTQAGVVLALAAAGDALSGQRIELGPVKMLVGADGRPGGTLDSPVLAGSLMALLIAPVATLAITARVRRLVVLAALAVLLGVLAVLATQTRGAILTLLVAGAICGMGLQRRRWLPRWVFPAVIALVLLSVVPLWRVIENRVAGDDSGSAASRKHLAAIASEIILDHPVFGVGAGNAGRIGQRYAAQSEYRGEWFYTFHCKYLLVWVETGILGFAAFMGFLGSVLYQARQTWRHAQFAFAPLGLALGAAVVGHMAHMLVDVFNSRPQVQMLWVVAGLLAALYAILLDSRDPAAALRRGATYGR